MQTLSIGMSDFYDIYQADFPEIMAGAIISLIILGRIKRMKLCNNCKYLGKQRKAHLYVCTNPRSRFRVSFPHKKTREACDLYTSAKGRQDIDFSKMEGMRFIEDYRGKFQGSDIWVIGCDPNLDCYPDDFFDDRVSITLNYACAAFPNSTYFCGDGMHTRLVKSRWPHLLKKCLNALSLVKPKRIGTLNWWETWGLDPIYFKILTKSHYMHTKADFETMGEQIFGDRSCIFVGGLGSSDYAVQAAAVLGAKRIIMVGCSMTTKKYQSEAQRRGMSELYPLTPEGFSVETQTGQGKAGVQTRQSTARFAEIFKRYGVEIIRHRFDEGEEKFEFVEIKSEGEDLWEIERGW